MTTRIESDILIIGSGAAGGVLAATLSERTGLRIVLVEKGGFYGSEFFNQREWDMRVLYSDEGRRSTDDGAIPVRGGECVGGGTTVNYALAFDPIERVWQGWRRDFGLEGFSFSSEGSDYGIAGLNVPMCLRAVRERIGVHEPAIAEINDNNQVLADGCARLGYRTRQFELNMRDCLGCGYCGEGCAYDRKQSTLITYIPDAVSRGVQLVHHCDIESLDFEHRGSVSRAIGALGRVRETKIGSRPNSVASGPVAFRARLVLVCCGAIETPALLQRSRVPDPTGAIGRGLVLHPALPVVGLMNRELTNYRGVSGTVYSDQFSETHGLYLEGLLGHPVYGSVVLPSIGPEHFELMRQIRRMAGFGVLLIDSVDPRNAVQWDANIARARIRYRLSRADRERLRFGATRAVEVLFAAGAQQVLLCSEESLGPLGSARFRDPAEARYCKDLQFTSHRTTVTSAHCQSTVKMGEDPRLCPVDSRGESRTVRNLVVCDSSVFPTSCGENPMLSIMTMARYQGIRISSELARYGL